MKQMSITCLGVSGSGKTVVLGTLLDSLFSPSNARDKFYLLDRGVKGGRVMTDNNRRSDISIIDNLESIGVKGYKGYPPGSKATTLRSFSLMHVGSRTPVLEIDWLDYKGGLIRGEQSDLNDQEELYRHLDASTAIVVYLDGYRIATAKTVQQAQRFVGMTPISQILAHLESSKKGAHTNILVVLTQCDAIEDKTWIGKGDYLPLKEKAQEVMGGLISMIKRNEWKCGIVAVSAVGIGNNRRKILKEATAFLAAQTDDEICEEPKPLNVVESFFWLTACQVEASKRLANVAIYEANHAHNLEIERLGNEYQVAKEATYQRELERQNAKGFLDRVMGNKSTPEFHLEMAKVESDYKATLSGAKKSAENHIKSIKEQLDKYDALQALIKSYTHVVSEV